MPGILIPGINCFRIDGFLHLQQNLLLRSVIKVEKFIVVEFKEFILIAELVYDDL